MAENMTRIITCGTCGQRMRVPVLATERVYECVKCGSLVEDKAGVSAIDPGGMRVLQRLETKDAFAMLLCETGLATAEQVANALSIREKTGAKLFDILIREGHLKRDEFHSLMSRQGGIASLGLSHFTLDRELVNILPRDVVVQHFVLPIDRLGRLLTVAMVCPMDMEAIAVIQQVTRLRVKPMLCTYDDFLAVVQKHYGVALPGPAETAPGVPGILGAAGMPGTGGMPGAAADEEEKVSGTVAEQQAREHFAAAVSGALMERVDKVDRLEIGAGVPARVAALVGTGEEGLVKLVSVLGGSPPLATIALWTANTAAYGIPECVDNLPMAVVLLGDEGINLLASNARHMSADMEQHLSVLTRHARRAGEAAGLLARATKRAIPNVAQCAGALYPIGSFVLAILDPAEYMKIDPALFGRARVEAERAVFGSGHDEVGGRLLGQWHMATSIVEAVRCYTDPEEAGDYYGLAAIVQVAVASINADGTLDSGGLKGVAPSMESLGLDTAGVKAALAQLNG